MVSIVGLDPLQIGQAASPTVPKMAILGTVYHIIFGSVVLPLDMPPTVFLIVAGGERSESFEVGIGNEPLTIAQL